MQSQVKLFMSGTPAAIEVDAGVDVALRIMSESGTRHLPVVDRDRRVIGMLSLDDLRAAFPHARTAATTGDAATATRVGEVMTHAPPVLQTRESLETAAELLADAGVECVPIVDEEGRLEGLLSVADCLQALVTMLWTERHREGGTERLPGRPPARTLVDTLRAERAALAAQLEGYQREEQSLTDARREQPLDLAEHGEDVREADLAAELAEHAARRLHAVERALERADAGRLAVCERCEGAIPEGRLRALPGTTLCVRCASEIESGAR